MTIYAQSETEKKPLIGLLAFGIQSSQLSFFFNGVNNAVNSRKASIICFPEFSSFSVAGKDSVFNLISNNQLKDFDGIIAYLPQNQNYIHEIISICNNINISLIFVDQSFETIPAVIIDIQSGYRELVKHFISHHKFRRIAFIRGAHQNIQDETCYRIFLETLMEHGLRPDNKYIISGDGTRQSGINCVKILFDRVKTDCDAILCANDEMALGVLAGLSELGIRVPYDIALAGFGDSEESKYTTPPLTTVSKPLFNSGWHAGEMILDLIEGKTVSNRIYLPSEFVIRQSCGCSFGANLQKIHFKHAIPEKHKKEHSFKFIKERIISEISSAVTSSSSIDKKDSIYKNLSQRLYKAFIVDAKSKLQNVFLSVLDEILRDSISYGLDVLTWQNALWILRNHAKDILSSHEMIRAEELFQNASIMIAESAKRAQTISKFKEQWLLSTIRTVAKTIITTFDITNLLDIIANGLRNLGVMRGYIVFNREMASTLLASKFFIGSTSKMVLALSFDSFNVSLYPEGGMPLSSNNIIPKMALDSSRPFSMIAFPILIATDVLGFIIIEAPHPEIEIYEIFAEQISSALNVSLLMKKINDQAGQIAIVNRQLEFEISQRKKAQDDLNAAKEQAETASKSKSMFLANMSHELRTPLNAIVGYSEMLADDAKEKNDIQLYEDLQKIRNAGIHLRAIVNDILDFSKIEAGRMTLYLEEFPLAIAIKTVAETIKPQLLGKDVALNIECDDSLGTIYADLTKVRQILLNILGNAVKFTSKGFINIFAQKTTFNNNDVFRIVIKDTGIGMTKEQIKNAFSAFTQASSQTSHLFGGTGLGLAISQKLCELMGGNISVQSEIGKGSEFEIILPVKVKNISL